MIIAAAIVAVYRTMTGHYTDRIRVHGEMTLCPGSHTASVISVNLKVLLLSRTVGETAEAIIDHPNPA